VSVPEPEPFVAPKIEEAPRVEEASKAEPAPAAPAAFVVQMAARPVSDAASKARNPLFFGRNDGQARQAALLREHRFDRAASGSMLVDPPQMRVRLRA
jgi:hypothetical protein